MGHSVWILRKWSGHPLQFYSNCHYPIWWTSGKFEWNLSRNGIIIKLFSWGGVSQGGTNCSYLAMFKALLLPNYIREQPQYFRDASNFAKYWKNNIIYIVTIKSHGPPKLTVCSSCYKFSKIFKHCHCFISWEFSLIFGRIVADKIIFDLRKFYCNISKGLWDILGQTWHEMKKLEKGGTFVTLVTDDCGENLRWKNFHIFIMIWQVYHTKIMNGSQCFHREKIWQSLCKNYKFCVIQRS